MKRIERARNVVRRGGGRENEERDVCAPVSWSVRDSGQGLEEERREREGGGGVRERERTQRETCLHLCAACYGFWKSGFKNK